MFLRSTLVVLCTAVAASAQVSMTLLGTIDVSPATTAGSPSYVGNNPSAVAWNGTDLFVGGLNASGLVANTAIVKVSTPLTTPVFGTAFGVLSTPNSRGYTGLAVRGNVLAASWDDGAVSPNGITAWDLNGAPLWTRSTRGSSGVAFDPGFFGAPAASGVGWTTFGSGRRALQDTVSGANVYDGTNGMIILAPAPDNGTTWRDMAFDSETGDIWLRMGNKVLSALRVGDNAVANNQVAVQATSALTILSQNLAFVRQPIGKVVFWNDRAVQNAGQNFFDVVRCVRASDNLPMVVDWGTFAPATGNAAYDFSYDEASGTMAISDLLNRQVHIFRVSVFNEIGVGCPGQGGFAPQLRAVGSAWPNGLIDYRVTQAAPLSLGLYVFGDTPVQVPLPFPGGCDLYAAPLAVLTGLFVTAPGPDGSGTGSLPVPIAPGLTGLSLVAQAAILENGDLNTLRTTNGVQVILP